MNPPAYIFPPVQEPLPADCQIHLTSTTQDARFAPFPRISCGDRGDCTHETPEVTQHNIRISAPERVRRLAAAISILPLLLAILTIAPLPAQTNDPTTGGRYYGTTGERVPYDTAGQREARQRSMEAAPLLERPVDPATYLVGPNDILVLSIPSADVRPVELTVYPDGSVVVPRVGTVRVADLTLSEASNRILDNVSRIYRSTGASVSLKGMRQFKVSVLGDVRRPSLVVATPATRLSEAIDLAGGANTTANRRNIILVRNGERRPVDLLPFYATGNLESNPYLQGGDVIWLGVQDPSNIIAIYGAVNRGGEFDYREGDSVSTLIRASFGLQANAIRDSIRLVSVSPNGDTLSRVRVRVLPDGTVLGDRQLQPGDRVFVPGDPLFFKTSSVVVTGAVARPGSFAIVPGRTRLIDVVEQFGGFSPDASLIDAVVIRRKDYLKQIDQKLELIRQIDPDKRSEEDLEYLRNKSTERPGIMTVNFTRLLQGDQRENITLEDLDSIYVPIERNYVKVVGKVKNPGNVTYMAGAGFEAYIAMAGGYGYRADESETKVIKSRNSDTYSADSDDYVIEPGDQIFVPEEKEGDFWRGFTQAITIVAQIGTIVAVILSIRSQ